MLLKAPWTFHGAFVKANCLTAVNVIMLQVKGRDGKQKKRGRDTWNENRRNTWHLKLVWLVWFCMCAWFFFPHYLTKMRGAWRRRGHKCLSKWKIATIPYHSYCNHFSPFPICVPECVDAGKRCDASYCMTNWDELIHLSTVSFLNRPRGSACISPIQWLSNSNNSLLLCHTYVLIWNLLTLPFLPLSPPCLIFSCVCDKSILFHVTLSVCMILRFCVLMV